MLLLVLMPACGSMLLIPNGLKLKNLTTTKSLYNCIATDTFLVVRGKCIQHFQTFSFFSLQIKTGNVVSKVESRYTWPLPSNNNIGSSNCA